MPDQSRASAPTLVLIADDHEWSARSLRSLLEPEGYAVLHAFTGRQAVEIARATQPAVVLLDLHMPYLSGVEVCRQLRADPRVGSATPILVTTATPLGRAERLEALQAGAWDVLVHPVDGELLLAKLANLSAAKREVERVRDDSLIDLDTGIYNLRGLSRRASEVGADALRRHDAVACIALAANIERAPAGAEADEARVTELLVNAWRTTGRVSDVIGRLGRTEFGIIAPHTEVDGATRLVERLRDSVDEEMLRRPDWGAARVHVRARVAAVDDAAMATTDVVGLLLRAAAALRQDGSVGEMRLLGGTNGPAA